MGETGITKMLDTGQTVSMHGDHAGMTTAIKIMATTMAFTRENNMANSMANMVAANINGSHKK